MFPREIILFLICFIKIISYDQKQLDVYYSWDEVSVWIFGIEVACPNCIPYRMKVANNGSIVMSIPRLYNPSSIKRNEIFTTFIVLKTDFEPYYFYNWPSDQIIVPYLTSNYKIYSVMGFVIDDTNERHFYYLLDQGRIFSENNTVSENTTKLVKVNDRGIVVRTYYFNGSEYTNSLLTDVVIDHAHQYAYITDSGNLLNNQSIPKIIVLDLENDKIYKVLNNHESFKPDENITITYSENGNKVYDYFTNITGVNSIQLSCDGGTLFYSSLKSNNIYSVSTRDILLAIENYEDTKNENYLNDIKVNSANKNFVSESILVSSKNNLFMTNVEKRNIEISYSVEDKLTHFNYNDYSEIASGKFQVNWPSSLDIYKGNLYLLDNHFYYRNDSEINDLNHNMGNDNDTQNETIGKFVIYRTELKNDELSYKKGCTVYMFKLNMYSFFLMVWFTIIFIIIIILANANERKGHNKKKKKLEQNEENVKELNKKLKEKENEEEEENDDDEDNNEHKNDE